MSVATATGEGEIPPVIGISRVGWLVSPGVSVGGLLGILQAEAAMKTSRMKIK
jgi:hypothetical protein